MERSSVQSWAVSAVHSAPGNAMPARVLANPAGRYQMHMKTIKLSILTAIAGLFGLAATTNAAETGVPKDYPLTTCPVSGEKLGEHGKPVKVSHEGTDVYLCCKSCKKDFEKEPAKFAKAVKDAKKQ
jgi:YHS domain-containing protein